MYLARPWACAAPLRREKAEESSSCVVEKHLSASPADSAAVQHRVVVGVLQEVCKYYCRVPHAVVRGRMRGAGVLPLSWM